MLPNHAPLVIAEQFGTLATMYPGRIDLGLGRAPGSDQNTMFALRRDPSSAASFPQDVLELQGYLSGRSVVPGVDAVPGAGSNVPLYILGSSMFGASSRPASGCRMPSHLTSRRNCWTRRSLPIGLSSHRRRSRPPIRDRGRQRPRGRHARASTGPASGGQAPARDRAVRTEIRLEPARRHRSAGRPGARRRGGCARRSDAHVHRDRNRRGRPRLPHPVRRTHHRR